MPRILNGTPRRGTASLPGMPPACNRSRTSGRGMNGKARSGSTDSKVPSAARPSRTEVLTGATKRVTSTEERAVVEAAATSTIPIPARAGTGMVCWEKIFASEPGDSSKNDRQRVSQPVHLQPRQRKEDRRSQQQSRSMRANICGDEDEDDGTDQRKSPPKRQHRDKSDNHKQQKQQTQTQIHAQDTTRNGPKSILRTSSTISQHKHIKSSQRDRDGFKTKTATNHAAEEISENDGSLVTPAPLSKTKSARAKTGRRHVTFSDALRESANSQQEQGKKQKQMRQVVNSRPAAPRHCANDANTNEDDNAEADTMDCMDEEDGSDSERPTSRRQSSTSQQTNQTENESTPKARKSAKRLPSQCTPRPNNADPDHANSKAANKTRSKPAAKDAAQVDSATAQHEERMAPHSLTPPQSSWSSSSPKQSGGVSSSSILTNGLDVEGLQTMLSEWPKVKSMMEEIYAKITNTRSPHGMMVSDQSLTAVDDADHDNKDAHQSSSPSPSFEQGDREARNKNTRSNHGRRVEEDEDDQTAQQSSNSKNSHDDKKRTKKSKRDVATPSKKSLKDTCSSNSSNSDANDVAMELFHNTVDVEGMLLSEIVSLQEVVQESQKTVMDLKAENAKLRNRLSPTSPKNEGNRNSRARPIEIDDHLESDKSEHRDAREDQRKARSKIRIAPVAANEEDDDDDDDVKRKSQRLREAEQRIEQKQKELEHREALFKEQTRKMQSHMRQLLRREERVEEMELAAAKTSESSNVALRSPPSSPKKTPKKKQRQQQRKTSESQPKEVSEIELAQRQSAAKAQAPEHDASQRATSRAPDPRRERSDSADSADANANTSSAISSSSSTRRGRSQKRKRTKSSSSHSLLSATTIVRPWEQSMRQDDARTGSRATGPQSSRPSVTISSPSGSAAASISSKKMIVSARKRRKGSSKVSIPGQ